MPKLNIEDLKKIKDKVHAETALREGDRRVKITVHMGTCGIASGANDVMSSLLGAMEEAKVSDVVVTTSGCMGLCSREPLVTVEVIGQDPIKYEYVDAMKMRQIFKRHVMEGEIQLPFVLARGAETTK